MGGTAGHAGLFGTASDVAALTEAYLGPMRGRDGRRCCRRIWRAKQSASRRPIPSCGADWAGHSRRATRTRAGGGWTHASFGHTGFVGTCVWADPVRDFQAVLLTNSVYFGRADTRAFRAAFYEAAVEDLQRGSSA